MSIMKISYYVTPGHGYLRVPKKTFLEVGGDPTKITQYSGHDENTLYLEEDCDAGYFLNLLEENGIEFEIKNVYKDSGWPITHNYSPELFDVELTDGLIVELINGFVATVSIIGGRYIVKAKGNTWKIPKTNPFKYITEVKS